MSCDGSEREDVVAINKRGQVRPVKYNSKYKKIRAESGCIEGSSSGKPTAYQEAEEVIAPDKDDKAQECQSHGHRENEDIYMLHMDESDDVTDNDTEFINFLKEKNETSLDDLIKVLETDNRWTAESDIDDDFIDEDEEHEEIDGNTDEDEPIQAGHFLSIKTSVLLIWLLAITHSFTSRMLSDTLTVINLHLLIGYPALKSVYHFKRFFNNLKSSFVKHFYCSFCLTELQADHKKCPNSSCQKDTSNSREYFLELPIVSQLSALYSQNDFIQGLKHRSQRVKKNERNIEDVYDSSNYRKLMGKTEPLCGDKESHISFILNTDGIPIFKSSKTSIWPIFLMINELPFRMRKARENMIMCGLWFGKTKPDMNMFCGPLHKAFISLEHGINIKTNCKSETFKVHGYLYSVSCDIPARSSVMNMNQHNGECCCPKCLQTGCNLRTPTGCNVRVFPYQQNDPCGPKRESINMIEDSQKATSLQKAAHVNGIKGPSFLMFCPRYDCVENVAIDVMHLLYLGVIRLIMKLWFNISHSLEPFSLYRYVDIVDSRLLHIKPFHLISRVPRSIVENLKFWKAAEYRSWFFFTLYHA